jgi:hypothetical protein
MDPSRKRDATTYTRSMAETVTIDGHPYLRRNPLGVVGLTLITFGIYGFYWWWKINEELRLALRDDSISPTRSLMAMLFGWIVIVPPFIAAWNTATHLQDYEQRVGVRQTLEPVLVLVFMVVLTIANGAYMQDHLNRAWDAASAGGQASALPPPPPR